jgi:hypothetical protein
VTTPWEHGAASGPSAAQSRTKDGDAESKAAPGPSRTRASGEATRLGACNLWWRVKIADHDEARRTTCQPQPGRARAAPAAHACHANASYFFACEREPRRSSSHQGAPAGADPDGSLLTGGNDAPNRYECAAGAARALRGCGWQLVLAPRWWRGETTSPNGTRVRLAPPAPSRAAVGSWCWRHGGGEGKRRRLTARVCGRRRPRPPGLRLAGGASGLVVVGDFHTPPQVTCAQPSGLSRCTSARGPRRCLGLRIAVLCPRLCSAGTRRCPVLPGCRHARTFVQRRARTQLDTYVNTRPPWSVWPDSPSREVHKARMRDCQERRGG